MLLRAWESSAEPNFVRLVAIFGSVRFCEQSKCSELLSRWCAGSDLYARVNRC